MFKSMTQIFQKYLGWIHTHHKKCIFLSFIFSDSSEKVTQLLNSTGSFTIFAPTDDAFDQLPRQAVNELIDDTKALENILTKHVVTRSLLSPSLTFVDLVTAGKAKIKVSKVKIL